jgi:branched-chain amino acid transport system ATP-binding protein
MLLEAKGITKSFGGLVALENISINAEEGETLGLIGPNGAGKTTFFELVSGFLKPDKGKLTFDGEEIAGFSPHAICNKGIARTFQLVKPFRNATAGQNALIAATFGGKSRDAREARALSIAALETVGLHLKKDVPAKDMTLSELKRLEIARALSTNPRLLLLDEVMAGLDQAEIHNILDLIRTIQTRKITIVIVEHVMPAVVSVANRLIVLDHGKKIAEGMPMDVVNDETVISAYLGEDHAAYI